MYRLVVSAFDGALIDEEEAIPTSTMLELDDIRQKALFCIATGRDLDTILYYNSSFPFLDYVVAYNGALVYDVKKEKILFKKTLGIRIIKKINKLFNDYSIKYCYIDKDIYKIEVYGTRSEVKNAISVLVENELDVNYTMRSKDNKFFVEIVSKDISKFSGVEIICKKNKIKLCEVMAFGSDVNDLELIKNVGYGVAMKNASSVIKKIARKVTSTNNDKGVEKVIKEYF